MADEQDKTRSQTTRTKVSLKVSAPHVSRRAKGSGDADNSKNEKQARKGAMFLGVVVALYVVYLVLTGQMGQFLKALSQVDTTWILRACLCFLLYYAFGVLAYGIAVYLDHDSPLGVRDLMSVEASGIFFGNLTPMMAGSVPSQIYRMTRSGLDVGEASATQFTRFIAFQFGVVLFAAIMLVAKAEYFFQTYGDLFILNIVVFAVHFLELAGIFVICLCPRLVMRVGNWAIRFASKRGWLKDRGRWDEMVNVQVMEFANAFKTAASDLPSMALTLLVTMCQLGSLYMIPWFVLGAFGIKADFLECLAAGSMVQMVSSAVPLPGGTGGAEGGFVMFYGHMFGPSTSAGFLVWRIITFFGPTLLAAPLLGLRSNGGPSIYARVQRFKARHFVRGGRGPRAARTATISGSALREKRASSGSAASGEGGSATGAAAHAGEKGDADARGGGGTSPKAPEPARKGSSPVVVAGGIRVPMGGRGNAPKSRASAEGTKAGSAEEGAHEGEKDPD